MEALEGTRCLHRHGFLPAKHGFRWCCDEAQWRLLGISLAWYNAIFSLAMAAWLGGLMARKAP
jgi:disulfide bond formation protein DsbB